MNGIDESSPVPGEVAALGFSGDEPPEEPRRRRRLRRVDGGRRRPVKVLLTEDEYLRIRAIADRHEVTMQVLMVDSVLRPSLPTGAARQARLATFLAARRTVAGMATNLNQLAHWANAEHRYPVELNDTLATITGLINRLDEALAELVT